MEGVEHDLNMTRLRKEFGSSWPGSMESGPEFYEISLSQLLGSWHRFLVHASDSINAGLGSVFMTTCEIKRVPPSCNTI